MLFMHIHYLYSGLLFSFVPLVSMSIIVSHVRSCKLRDLTMLIPYCNSEAIRFINCADNVRVLFIVEVTWHDVDVDSYII